MAGRARGRGRGQYSFNTDALGLGRGESFPASSHKPSPLFPALQCRPLPLHTGEDVDYMLALKQELRSSSKNLPFHITAAIGERDVARYSDKYQQAEPKNNTIDWIPDWSRLPKELCVRVRKPRKTISNAKLRLKGQTNTTTEEVLTKLETLEKKELDQDSDKEEEEEEKKKKENEENEESNGDEEYDEEEVEDETDYIMSYFDNGEDFGAASDDDMDEAVY